MCSPKLSLRKFIAVVVLSGSPTCAMEYVTVERVGETTFLAGRIEVEAQDGGLLLLSRNGTLWALQPEEIKSRRSDDTPFRRMDTKELTEKTLKTLPDGFAVHDTAHYLIFYNTTKHYAHWCGSLYERLYRGFYNYWKKRGLKLHDPEMPLVAIVFDAKAAYVDFSEPELGDSVENIVGYYSLRTNQVTTFDLTGQGKLRTSQGRPRNSTRINQILSQPQAAPTVATIIHEATHQLSYNSGLQTRYADNPVWLSEGLAIYFETPDLRNSRGWRNIGKVNRPRLTTLQGDLEHRDSDALAQLITQDSRMRDAETATSAYAEAWGLCFYLSKKRSEEFSAYLNELSKMSALEATTSDQRLVTFRRHFGKLADVDRGFLRYVRSIRN